MADLELLGHAVQTLLKVVARGGIELIEAVDHAGELIALTVEQRGGVAVDLDLEVDEHLEVLTKALGLGSHLLGKGGARTFSVTRASRWRSRAGKPREPWGCGCRTH